MIEFEVYGKPAPQGSKRHVGNGVMVESSKAVRPWREAVKTAGLDALGGGFGFDRQTPVSVALTFYMARPKSHFRTGKNAHLLRDAAPRFPATKPDIDKLIRSTCDALTDAGVYHDDSCVQCVNAAKFYADDRPPGLAVSVWEVA